MHPGAIFAPSIYVWNSKSENIFWYQKLLFDIRKCHDFLISEIIFWYKKFMLIFWYQKFVCFSDIRNWFSDISNWFSDDFLIYQKINLWYQKINTNFWYQKIIFWYQKIGTIFSCEQAALRTLLSVRPSVRLSVCPSVCHTFFIMFPSWNFQEWLPMTEVISMQKVKVTEVET